MVIGICHRIPLWRASLVKFIHTADWQLGKPFSQFEEGLSQQLRQARIDMIETIANVAKDKDAPHVLVAGDVFDQEIPNPKTIRQSLDVMASSQSVTFYLLPGNHDPNRSNGLWSRLGELPKNVVPLLEEKPFEIEKNCFLLPAPWYSKNPGRDNTKWMNDAEIPKDSIRIAVAHGSIHDFEGKSEASQKCVISAIDRVKDADLDYFALGDWHGQINVTDRIFYSSTPEIDSFRSNDPGYVLSVEISSKGDKPIVERVKTTQFHWFGNEVRVLPDTDISAAFQNLLDADIPARRSLGRIQVTGSLPATKTQEIRNHLSSQTEALSLLEVDYTRLETTYSEDDFDDLSLSGSLRETADRLLERKNDDNYAREERLKAERALQLLLSYAGSS